MKQLARFFYIFGVVVAVGVFANGAVLFVNSGNPVGPVVGTALAFIAWFTTVGIGVRLGMTPLEFFGDVKRVLGLHKDWDASPPGTS